MRLFILTYLEARIYQNAFRDLKKAFCRWRDTKIKAELPTLVLQNLLC